MPPLYKLYSRYQLLVKDWRGDENTVKISFGGRISTRSEPFTITSKDGGRTIAVSSDSGTWKTDYLTKR